LQKEKRIYIQNNMRLCVYIYVKNKKKLFPKQETKKLSNSRWSCKFKDWISLFWLYILLWLLYIAC